MTQRPYFGKVWLLITVALAVACWSSPALSDTFKVEAWINGVSELYIIGDTVQWQNLEGYVPGYGCTEYPNGAPTFLSISTIGAGTITWYPDWSLGNYGKVLSERKKVAELNKQMRALATCITHVWDDFDGDPNKDGYPEISIVQFPSTKNDYRLIVRFDNQKNSAPAWYTLELKIPEPVAIDIKPGSDPSSINPKSKGKIPVAILSTEEFDAPSQVDQDSLTFGSTGDEESLSFCNNPEDVNGDGLKDLVCHFYAQSTGFQCGNIEGTLKGVTKDGTPIVGKDSVKIAPCK